MKKLLKLLIQLFILLVFNQVGIILVDSFHIPLPGNVLGMVLLFLCLLTGIVKLSWVDETSTILIKHLAFFFIPISVGLMTLGSIFMYNGFALLTVITISAFIGIILSGLSSQFFVKKRGGIEVESAHNHI
ncbi:CidA/LrgA family protein [Bacillus sp. 31A1R]|uniref:CidA/LrgA family protein n=1 Tax=Robertmurraya mangrovi TaxID=3098077 RepID=A0ABU5J574_9BACI|nr:CidA/LrgA family protein [Bacillus sp. 31A1R]MDZ5474521.1 CidA/LrgA family protein [Bacillus sp. 31A1R]